MDTVHMEDANEKIFLIETLQVVRRYYAYKAATVEEAKADATQQAGSDYNPHFHKEELAETIGQAYEITEADLFKMLPGKIDDTGQIN